MIYTTTEVTERHYYGKVYVQYATWLETYRGLTPNEFLDSRKLESCYESMLKYPQGIYAALVDEVVAGFIRHSPDTREYTRKAGMSEINVLYVLEKYQGHGTGRALMEKSLSMMPHKGAILCALRDNNSAIGFYEHMGFMLTGNTPTRDTGFGNIVELEMMRTDGLTGPQACACGFGGTGKI